MILVKATAQTESGRLPEPEAMIEMGAFNEGLARDGVLLLAAEGLHPSAKGTRLRFDDGRTTVTDGPFAETKELVCGFWIVSAKSREEVVERFTHAPFGGGQVVEIRQVFEPEDFGDRYTKEIAEQEARLCGRIA